MTTGNSLVTVNYTTSGLAAGTYSATITLTDPAASPTTKTIAVSLTVTAQPYLAVSPASIAVNGYAGLSGPQASLLVRNTGGGTLNYSASEPVSWLSLSPASGSVVAETDTVYVNFDATSLAVGTYNTTITVTSSDAPNSPLTVPVTFTVDPRNMVVTSPNGWENWLLNTSHNITWSSILGGNVKIELFKGGSLSSTLIASTPNTGSYNWTIPGTLTPGLDYKIQVTSVETPDKTDQSNLNFILLSRSRRRPRHHRSHLDYERQRQLVRSDGHHPRRGGRSGMRRHREQWVHEPADHHQRRGYLSFWWKVSSEANFDFLRFYVDGVEQGAAPGISGTVELGAEDHLHPHRIPYHQMDVFKER